MISDNLIICPVYNEESRLEEFYRRLRRNYSQDVIFVDDGSTDGGRNFLLSIKNKRTSLIRHSSRRGYGRALISGFSFALDKGYKRIVTIDADLQHKPEDISLFLRELIECEVVLGSRYIKISKSLDIPRTRLVINRYLSCLIKVLFSFEFTDPFCGLRGYRDSFLKSSRFKEQSYGIGLEILLEIVRKRASWREVPIEAIYFKDTRKFLDGLDDPRRRLTYYLEVISRKRKELVNEEKISLCKPPS